MATTAVVAEILVAGLQTAVWITLLVLAIFGAGWLDPSEIESWTALVTLLVFAGAYMLGVLTDRAADFLAVWLSSIFQLRQLDKPEGIDQMRLRLLARTTGSASLSITSAAGCVSRAQPRSICSCSFLSSCSFSSVRRMQHRA